MRPVECFDLPNLSNLTRESRPSIRRAPAARSRVSTAAHSMVPDTGSVKTASRVLRCLLFNRHSLPERLHYSQACLGVLMACYAEAVLAEIDDVEGEIAGLGDVEDRGRIAGCRDDGLAVADAGEHY